jgi:2-polyprenyl-3-methyl-5-hydroxy-6-metoxy-1,4-benzoquinol methylase
MSAEKNYASINKHLWNTKTQHHIKSDFYAVEAFLKGSASLNSIELNLLGNIKGKSILHLQCHFGQDSISLARMGAEVTGIDFSEEATVQARKMAQQTQTNVEFICCDFYELPKHLSKKFDVVFTSYGTIGWLPDINMWATIITTFLKPQGKLVFVEFHPVVWMFDNDFKTISYNYFKAEAIVETETGTYADRNASIELESVTWNHSLSEVMNSLLQNGLRIDSFNEYDYSPYNCFNNTEEFEPKKFRIKHLKNNVPMVYAIQATLNKQTDEK